jgi:DNA-binding GntR family transcriptional regulator
VDKLDLNDSRPPYRQVAARLQAAIDAGKYPPGSQLPSYEQLAEEFGVAIGTAKRAVGVLRDENVVVTRHGMGTFVRTPEAANPDDELTENARLRQELGRLTDRVAAIERQLANE